VAGCISTLAGGPWLAQRRHHHCRDVATIAAAAPARLLPHHARREPSTRSIPAVRAPTDGPRPRAGGARQKRGRPIRCVLQLAPRAGLGCAQSHCERGDGGAPRMRPRGGRGSPWCAQRERRAAPAVTWSLPRLSLRGASAHPAVKACRGASGRPPARRHRPRLPAAAAAAAHPPRARANSRRRRGVACGGRRPLLCPPAFDQRGGGAAAWWRVRGGSPTRVCCGVGGVVCWRWWLWRLQRH